MKTDKDIRVRRKARELSLGSISALSRIHSIQLLRACVRVRTNSSSTFSSLPGSVLFPALKVGWPSIDCFPESCLPWWSVYLEDMAARVALSAGSHTQRWQAARDRACPAINANFFCTLALVDISALNTVIAVVCKQ